MSAVPKVPIEDAVEAAARACAQTLLAQGFTAEDCVVLAFVKGASYGVVARRALEEDIATWPKT